jgi:uncharacterized membrane protein (UPF0127 family)
VFSSLLRRGVFAILAAVVLVAPACAQVSGAQPRLRTEPMTIETSRGPVKLTVEMADTERTRELGLMFRDAPPRNEGMLFDFHEPQEVSFWMKNTKVSLDLLFISQDGRIIRIARNATPFSEEPIPSGAPIRGVLEIAAGRSKELGIAEGDKARQRIFTSQ